MFTRPSRVTCQVLLATFISASAANASEQSYWLIGVIGQIETTRLDASKIDTSPIPYVAWQSGGLYIGIDEMRFEFGRRDDLQFSAILEPRFALDSESPRFDELERDFALEAGGSVAVGFFPWLLTAKATSDVTGTHNGHLFQLSLSQAMPFGPGEFEFSFAAEYQSAELAMHLYGISVKEASSELTAFDPGGIWKPSVSASYFLELGNFTGMQVEAEVSSLPDEVSNSERVNDTVQVEAYIAIIRQF